MNVADLVKRLRVEFDEWTLDPTHDARQEAADMLLALSARIRELEGALEEIRKVADSPTTSVNDLCRALDLVAAKALEAGR